MVKTVELPHTYDHPFELVAEAYQARFPTHPLMPDMIGAEEVEGTREEDKETGIVKVTRRITLKSDAPGWLTRLSGVDSMVFIETMVWDKKGRKMTLEGTNETLSTKLKLKETCIYSPDPEDPEGKTVLDQTANFEILISLLGFASKAESWGLNKYKEGVKAGKSTDEAVIQDLKNTRAGGDKENTPASSSDASKAIPTETATSTTATSS